MFPASGERHVTVLTIGGTGDGKSAFGNAFLGKKDSFEESSDPDSCTYETSSQSAFINGVTRHYIDTQGLKSTDGMDASYIQQMVQFLKDWKLGINAFFIILNVQSPRFDQDVQRMLRLMNDFFNNPEFWNQTGIIFTKCFKGKFNRKVSEGKFRQRVIDFIKSFEGCNKLNPQMPCFFVDSTEFETEEDTKFELIRIYEYAHKNQPLPTIKLVPVRPEYKKKEEVKINKKLIKTEMQGHGGDRKRVFYYEDQVQYRITGWDGTVTYSPLKTIRKWTECEPMPEGNKSKEEIILKKQLIKSELVGEGINQERIFYYEDQVKYKITGWDDSITFTEPKTLRSYTEVKKCTVKEEYKIEKQKNEKEIFKTVKRKTRSICKVFGPRLKKDVHDYYEITTIFTKYKRLIITSPDGNVQFTDWDVVEQWEEKTTRP